MPLAAGQRLGSYEILSIIGVGGMGEVYKARDTRLERIVAIKALPDHVASDPDLRQRFEREAKAISSLSHPHICTLHDVGSEGGIEYLVMEYLEGESLAQRLTRGALPLPQVLRYAMEIAEALDRAHRQGVTHRDLKPGNIMLTKSGAKLLDFGLAKLKTTGVIRSSASAATVSPNVTASGTIIGTLQYMAPEQVEGKPVDQRADIFSFGAIVYEMATGKKAFEGDTQASLIGAILRAEPPAISTLQPLSPPALDALVATCLAKDPDERWQSAGDVARQLRMMQGSTPSGASLKGAIAPKPAGTKLSLSLALMAMVVVGVVAALAAWMLAPRAQEEPRQVSRFTITPSAPLSRLAGWDVNISPDGKRIVYFVETDKNGGIQLYVRDLAELEARSVPGGATIESTAGNMNPFFSPDGRSLGVLLPGQGIVRINLEGGPPTRVLNEQGVFLGAVWTPDDVWVVSGGNAFYRVSARGGATPERLEASTDDPSAPFRAGPTLLPGGNVMLFGLITGEKEDIAALDLRTRDQHIVLEAGSDPWYVAPGYLVFARATTVMGVRFDPRKLVTVGQPAALLQDVRHPDQNSAADFAVSENGTLVYIPDDGRNAGTGSVVWVERDGHVAGPAVTGALEQPRDPRLSPDGRRLLLTTGSFADGDIWIYDLSGRPPLPLIVPGDNSAPVWSPDGSEVAFKGAGGIGFGGYDIRVLPADGSQTKARSVHAGELGGAPIEWSAAGELFVYGGDHQDLAVASIEDGPVRELVPGPETKGHAAVSRDGHWLAYESNRSGVVEIWAKRYPDGVAVRVSQGGGREPLWSRDGRELFYRQPDAMMAVPVDPSAGDFGPAKWLFEAPFYFTFDASVRTYDVAADGRFLMVQLNASEGRPRSASIVVVQNWAEELKQRLGPAP